MKIAIFWYTLTGYLNACLKALNECPGVEIFVAHKSGDPQAPFDNAQFGWIANQLYWRSARELSGLRAAVEEFNPDAIVICGWVVKEYMTISRAYKGKAIRIMTMDNNWLNTPKQRVAALISSFYIQPYADGAWVPGERQSYFARRLGFEQEDIMRGSYSCDQDAFAQVFKERLRNHAAIPRRFLFVGRFVEEKGIRMLVEAYQEYRNRSADPWPLLCCGKGPLEHLLLNQSGIQVMGFVQPADLPKTFAESGCFVLPSTFEPWGVVVHEAASAGLTILASERVGSTPHLVQYNYNGYIFGADNPSGLAALMDRISKSSEAKLQSMSEASHKLSEQFVPSRWADSLIGFLVERIDRNAEPTTTPS